ncbi:DUF885 domain-containing protein [bacterium]|nr:DUF885 domain-containing protein [bacterium]
MKRTLLFLLPVLLLLFSCSSDSRSDEDRAFEALADRFLQQYLATFPEAATALGDHRFDDLLNDCTAEGYAEAAALYRAYRDTLRSIRVETLSPEHMIDYDIFQHVLDEGIFEIEELREWQWNPLDYNASDAIYLLIARDGIPLEQRMRSAMHRMNAMQHVLGCARVNLQHPPLIHTQTAILQNAGSIALLEVTMQPFIDSLPPALRDSVSIARDAAVQELEAYELWLRNELLDRSTGDFRLGEELYSRKFALQLDTDLAPQELLEEAERLLDVTTEEMDRVASSLYAKLMPEAPLPAERGERIRAVLDLLAQDHPSDSTIVGLAETTLEEARAFVLKHQLVTVPKEPLDIIVMPEFQRGVAVAYCDSPGALEKNGKTFFAIAPTPEHWPESRRASFYREYNTHMLKDLVVHEAMPGHYLQLVTANHAETPTLLRNVFPSGVFAEGWATYCEQFMADAGFGGEAMHMQQLKMYLRLLINAIIDQRIHRGGMSEAEAMDLMMRRGFQEEGEAAGKWRRACLTSVQLSTYFYGNMKIRQLRDRVQAAEGEQFSLRAFHDRLLSFGTINPKYHPMLMKLPAPSPPVAAR